MFNYHTDIELKEAKASFPKAYVGTYGELRWKSNDRVPMEDMLGFWVELGFITEDEMKKAKKVAWYLKKAEEAMASEPKLETEGKEG